MKTNVISVISVRIRSVFIPTKHTLFDLTIQNDGNGRLTELVSAGSVPPSWGGQSLSPGGFTLVASVTATRSVASSSHIVVVPLCKGGTGVQGFSRSA